MSRARSNWLLGLMALPLVLAGCNNGQKTGPKPQAMPGPAPTVAELSRSEERRIGGLAELSSLGVIELRWTDESGNHWEQGDIELSYVAPSETALVVKKLGEIFLWAGSGSGEYWLFDNRSRDQSVAFRGREADLNRGTDLAHMLHPLLILDLAGLTPLVTMESAAGEVAWDAEAGLWLIRVNGRSGPLNVSFAPSTLEPQRIEAIDAAGATHVMSHLSRPVRVPVDGLPDGAFPVVPGRVEVSLINQSGTAVLALDRVRGEVDEARKRLIFSFDALNGRLRPARIEPFRGE